MGEETVEALVGEAASRHEGPSRSGGWYSADGDCVFFHAEDVPYHAVRLTDLVTVYEALDDDRPVGLQIKGIRAGLRADDRVRLEITKYVREGGEVLLSYLVGVALQLEREPVRPEPLGRVISESGSWRLPARELEPVTG
jgi:hypothetical protein